MAQLERLGIVMKKVQWFALVMVMILMVSACGSSKRDSEIAEQGSPSKETVTTSSKDDEIWSNNGHSQENGQASVGSVTEETKAESALTFSFDDYAGESDRTVTFVTPESRGETYEVIEEEGYLSTWSQPLSTFSIDVDTASYSNVRRYLDDNMLPPSDAVKIEEMVNYFNYDYEMPKGDLPFSINTEIGPCPWNDESRIAMIGLQGLEIEREARPKTNLVFLMDVSGSMDSPDKLPLLKEAFDLLTDELGENDRVSLVVYAGASGLVLDGASGDDKSLIMKKIYELDAGGSTAGSEGIKLAYDVALDNFVYNGNNRVIIATDGDFNVGITSHRGLEEFIESKRDEGIFLSVLGFGTGNTDFQTMETLADKGNGHFAYIDSVKEAEKVLVEELTGTLYTIAKDVKIQVEFNPNYIKSYRLVGYENRRLANEDFNNDQVDAGDIGAGHTVTALYEIKFFDEGQEIDDLRYQNNEGKVQGFKDELMFVKLRYKAPQSDVSQLIERPVNTVKLFDEVSDDFMFATSVAEFGLLLRQSEYRGTASFSHIYTSLRDSGKVFEDEYKFEFLQLVAKAEGLLDNYGYIE